MRAVVTGADGFLGANMCKVLIEGGHEVTGTGLHRRGHTSLDALGLSCRIEYGDVTDPAFVERVLSAGEAEWVFHLAAVSIVRIAQASPARTFQTNVLGTVNVLEACRRLGSAKAILVASSDKAYGYHGHPYREDLPLLPTAPYEVSKACADTIARCYQVTYDLPVAVTRCANLYGPGDLNWSRLVPNSCRLGIQGQAPRVFGEAWTALREWLYVEEAARAYLYLAEQGLRGAYNISSGEVATSATVASMIASSLGAPAPERQDKIVPFAEIPSQTLDRAKMNAAGWRSEVGLEAGIGLTTNWYSRYLRIG
jgi:CDP-glucose 4,6-dehydratase